MMKKVAGGLIVLSGILLLVSAAMAGGLTISGDNVTAGYFTGNGSALTGITPAQVGAAPASHTHSGVDIVNGTITDTKLANGAVIADKIGPGAVVSSKIAAGAVTNSHISGLIDGSKISSTGLDASTLEGQHANDIISAASDETRTAISSLPAIISSSGSYYLTDNLTSTGDGITVNADNVTIDFNGFTITGPGKTSGTGYGVYMNGRANVEIRNGTVRSFGLSGIFESENSARGHRIIRVRVKDNGVTGINLAGKAHLIYDCTSIGNGADGIYVTGSTIIGNTASDNGPSSGISAGVGSTIIGNTASGNSTNGVYSAGGCTINGNTASSNGWAGIYIGPGSTVRNNTAYLNGQDGIYLGGNDLVDGNTAYDNNQSGSGYSNITSCATCTMGLNHAP